MKGLFTLKQLLSVARGTTVCCTLILTPALSAEVTAYGWKSEEVADLQRLFGDWEVVKLEAGEDGMVLTLKRSEGESSGAEA